MSVQQLRGRQIKIGHGKNSLSFTFPVGLPETDTEIAQRIDTVAQIDQAIQPYRDLVKMADQVQRALLEDVVAAKRSELAEADDPQLQLFAVRDAAP